MIDLDSTFNALADPTRRGILAQLCLGEATALELARPFAMSQPAVSRHLMVLEKAGLIVTRIEGSKRPRSLAPNALQELDKWLELLRTGLERNYDRLDRLLEAQQRNSTIVGEN